MKDIMKNELVKMWEEEIYYLFGGMKIASCLLGTCTM
jgi:hypothetical protein